MATTRLIAMHVNKGKDAARCLKERIDYVINPDKTEEGKYVTTFGCDPETAANEFELMRQAYLASTGRYRNDEVIAYQLRQSFKPGEVTPEEANKIGCELADRFLKHNHAYIVSTHLNAHCVHNHISFSAVTLDCKHKFRNFLGSGKALGRLSDQICLEHKLSVVSDPRMHDTNYDHWLGDNIKLTNRDQLRSIIDEMLLRKPDGFDALMRLLADAGWQIKKGKQISLCPPGGSRFIRLDTLGEEYSEQALREAILGKRKHVQQPSRRMKKLKKVDLLIDIQAKIDQGKGAGYERWAKVFNVKQLANSLSYLSEHNIKSYDDLASKVENAVHENDELLEKVKAAESRLQEIGELKKAIYDYLKTREVFAEWKKSNWSDAFFHAHEQELMLHKSAKKVFDTIGGKIPTIKELNAEYNSVLSEKQRDYAKYRETRDKMRELLTVKANIDIVTERSNAPESERKPSTIIH